MVTTQGRNAAGCQLVAEVLRVSGSARLRVFGSSMLPAILPGDTLLVERTNPPVPLPGDVVLFQRRERLFAHRVVARQRHEDGRDLLVTGGDSLAGNDSPVFPDELLGRIAAVVRRGRHISPNATIFCRVIAGVLKNSDFLTACFLSLLNRTRSWRVARESTTC